jgi:penicillin-binding protein 2
MPRFRPGVTFPDFVISDSATRKSRIDDSPPRDFRRGWLVWMGVVVLFGLLTVRLSYLQLFYGERYRVLSDQNRIKKIKLPAQRGIIYDRTGKVLADNIKTELKKDQETIEGWKRSYPYKFAAAHVTGYLGEVGETEVGLLKSSGGKYDAGDVVGRSGLEAQYEEVLRGVDGGKLVEVDNAGETVRQLGKVAPVEGRDLHTTLDVELMKTAFEAMENKKGATIIANPKTGEVLGIVSSPSFDPSNLEDFLTDKNMPLFNRAIGAIYPPGSTFKMVTTTAAITDKKVPADFTYEDKGIITVNGFSYTNWLYSRGGRTEGWVGFARAIQRSTDTFFYEVGDRTTPEVIGKWAKLMGFGSKTGIDLPGEVEGLIPSPVWKEQVKGEKWFLGNTYHMAIGQGDVLVTPMQINNMTNMLANGGRECKPHLLMGIKPECHELPIEPTAMKLIYQGMVGACSDGGTAFPLFGFKPQVACKTGTAEYMTETGQMRTHGWLTAFAPASDPTISVTVVMEGGGEGSNVAAPIVRKVLSKYFGVADTYNYGAIPQENGE